MVALPYTLMWATGFSYDHRNIALAIPLLGLAAAFGAGVLWGGLKASVTKYTRLPEQRFRMVALGGLGAALLLALSSWLDSTTLMKQHNRSLINGVGVVPLNHALFGFFQESPAPGEVLTTYHSMNWIPQLKDRYYERPINRLTSIDRFLQELKNPAVKFVLFDRLIMNQALQRYMDAGRGLDVMWFRGVWFNLL